MREEEKVKKTCECGLKMFSEKSEKYEKWIQFFQGLVYVSNAREAVNTARHGIRVNIFLKGDKWNTAEIIKVSRKKPQGTKLKLV